jgi:hypothetical protein
MSLLRRFSSCCLMLAVLIQVTIAVAAAPAHALPCEPDCGGGGGGGTVFTSTITVSPPALGTVHGRAAGDTTDAIACSANGGTCSVTDEQAALTRPTGAAWPSYTFTYQGPTGYDVSWSGACTGPGQCTVVNSAAHTSLTATAVDVAPPDVSINSPGRVGPHTTISVVGSDNAGMGRYDWYLCHPDGTACGLFAGGDQTSIVNITNQPSGDYQVKVDARDTSGNITIATAAITYVASLGITWQAVPQYTETPSLSFQSGDEAHVANDADHRQCRAYAYGSTPPTTWGACTTANTFAPTLADGHWTLAAREIDDVDNEAIAVVDTIVDTTPPAVTLTQGPGEGSRIATTAAQVAFAATDANMKSVTCALDGAAAAPCTSPYMLRGYRNGQHTFTVTGTDQLGHTTSAVRHFVVAVPTTIKPTAKVTIAYGQKATLKATVSPAVATGTVQFRTANANTLCKATIRAGTAQCAVQSWGLTAGTRTLTAVYTGNYTGSSARLALVVNKATSAVHAKGPASVRHGRSTTVRASNLPTHANGRVTVSRHGKQLCAGKVSKGAAHCSFKATMKPGRYSFTVHYAGDGNYKGSTALVKIRVTR